MIILFTNFGNFNLDDVYYCSKKFKNYKNVIIHYTGPYTSIFEHRLCNILTNCILNFYEEKIIDRLINYNYFYFDFHEKTRIKEDCLVLLHEDNSDDFYFRKDTLWLCLYNYLHEYKTMVLQGFVNFRISSYVKSLDYAIDISVNKFIIEREYNEFIQLLKLYINSKPTSDRVIHLIYTNKTSILLDENKNVIPISDENFNAKYLSDISFSSNDCALNTLLNILPKEIYLHLIFEEDDEFISTLKLIFENKLHICTDCNICRTYRLIQNEINTKI